MSEQPIKILLVEDNEYDAKIVADLVAGLGGAFALRTADSLEKACAEDAAERADVVLLDLNLPDSYGPDTLVKSKALFADRPLIVMTGFYEEQLGVELIKKGAQDYLVKGKISRDWLSYSLKYAIERAKIEAQMRLREARLRDILEKIPDGFLVVRPDGRVLFANRGAELLLGRPRAELLAKLSELRGDLQKPLETELSKPDGRKIPAEIRAVELHWAGESCRLVMLRDLTPVRALERSRDEFISRVSHELRSPLTIVKEAISIVADGTAGQPSARQSEILKMGLDNVARLNRLIDALLDMAKIEAGVMPLDMAETDLSALAACAAKDYSYLAAEKKISLITDLPAALPPTWCDQDKIREVLANFLSNALKFTPEGGRISLSLRPWEGQALLRVENTGPGIDPEDLPKLFTKFAQLGREAGIKGTGLGLAISRGIAEMHQGRVWAESEPGRTSFFLLLPVLSFEEAARRLIRREIELAAGKRSFCALTVSLPPSLAGLGGDEGTGPRVAEFLRTRLRSSHAVLRRGAAEFTVLLSDSGEKERARAVQFLEKGLKELCAAPGAAPRISALLYPSDFSGDEDFIRKLPAEVV